MERDRRLAIGLAGLGAGVLACVLLGPLALDVLQYRTSDLARNQVVGGDAAALVVSVPVCLAAAVLAWRGHPAAPVVALSPAVFAVYTYSQLIMANEYLDQAGNVERFFPLLLTVVLLAAVVAAHGWRRLAALNPPVRPRRFELAVGWLLLTVAGFLVLGLHLGSYVDALADRPSNPQYLAAPTAFWTVKLWDLGVVAPATFAVGIGLLRGRGWARTAMYPVLGGFALLACSVTGMAWRMLLSGDPGSSIAQSLVLTGCAVAALVAMARLYRPLVAGPRPGGAAADPGDRPSRSGCSASTGWQQQAAVPELVPEVAALEGGGVRLAHEVGAGHG